MDTKRRSYDIFDIEERVHALELGGSTPTPSGGSWDYSTDEVDTKQKWIDGKEIYCKVIAPASPIPYTKQVWTEVGTITGIDSIVDTKVIFGYENRYFGEGGFLGQLDNTTGKISVYHDVYSGTIVDMVVFYTKAAASSKSRKGK